MLFGRFDEECQLVKLAELIRERNETSAEIATLIGRPAIFGHVGEYIASSIFDIQLQESATSKGIDGHFRAGPLAGKSVNVKWYGKQESILDITPDWLPDFYLVMTGPKSPAASSRGTTRPWLIEHVYLFNAKKLVSDLSDRRLRIGIATSVRQFYWQNAEIYPHQTNQGYILSEDQNKILRQFGASVRNGSQMQNEQFHIKIPRENAMKENDNSENKDFNFVMATRKKVTSSIVIKYPKIQFFIDDNKGYLKWLGDNPRGLVVNCEKNPKPNYLMLHRSTCNWISTATRGPGNWTNNQYIKLCSLEKGPLAEWAREEIGGELQPCQTCRP